MHESMYVAHICMCLCINTHMYAYIYVHIHMRVCLCSFSCDQLKNVSWEWKIIAVYDLATFQQSFDIKVPSHWCHFYYDMYKKIANRYDSLIKIPNKLHFIHFTNSFGKGICYLYLYYYYYLDHYCNHYCPVVLFSLWVVATLKSAALGTMGKCSILLLSCICIVSSYI